MKLVLLGAPGAGKGTQAELLKDTLNVVHISTGDIFREEMKNNTKLGQDIKSYVDSGNLVPDEVVTKIVANKFSKDKSLKKGWLLDGFPRTQQQAIDLDEILKKENQPLDYALYMEATLPVIIGRLTGRRICKKCGALYHDTNRRPQKNGICDVCGGPLYQRPDDNEETIKKRMDVYLESTTPIIDYYKSQKKLIWINANEDAKGVHEKLLKIFLKDKKFDQNKIVRRN